MPIAIQCVDREVAAHSVLRPVGGERDGCTPAIGRDILAQSRDFEWLALDDDRHSAMSYACGQDPQSGALRSQRDLLWCGVGRHVDIADGFAQQCVAHRAADSTPLVSRALQNVEDFHGRGVAEPRGCSKKRMRVWLVVHSPNNL